MWMTTLALSMCVCVRCVTSPQAAYRVASPQQRTLGCVLWLAQIHFHTEFAHWGDEGRS